MKLALAILLLIAGSAWAADPLVPESRRALWSIGETVGARISKPADGATWTITSYGATTNNGTNTGTIANNGTTLTLSSASGWAVSNGVQVIGYDGSKQSALITNLSGTTALLNSTIFVGGTNITVKHDNAPTINNLISLAAANDVIYIPAGDFVVRTGVGSSKSNWKLRSATNGWLKAVDKGAVTVGPTLVSLEAAQKSYIATVAGKGTNTLGLSPTNFTVAVGSICSVSTLNGSDPSNRVISLKGYERIVNQNVFVTNVSGTNIWFTPPLVGDFTNQPAILQNASAATTNVSLEGINIKGTNAGEFCTESDLIQVKGAVNCWVEGCQSLYAVNYNLHLDNTVHVTVQSNTFAHALSSGTSHALLLVEKTVGALVQNNIFDDSEFSIQQWNGGNMGNYYFANYDTNITVTSFATHNSHDKMNLMEQNVFSAAIETDGYYGSTSDDTFNGNIFTGSMTFKRFTYRLNIVSNILGSVRYNYKYDNYSPALTPSALMYHGEPNLSNPFYVSNTPPLHWHWPGTSIYSTHGSAPDIYQSYSNISYTFTSNFTGSNIIGNFTNWPYDAGSQYVIMFRDGANTNRYYYHSETLPLAQQFNGSLTMVARTHSFDGTPADTTNMLLSGVVTVSNGWTMLLSSTDNFQQRQDEDYLTHIITRNWVLTNQSLTPGFVEDPSVTGTVGQTSYAYTNGAPAWWRGGWPRVIPGTTNRIDAELRYVDTAEANTNPPTTFFNASPTNGARPLTVAFTSFGVTNAAWTFGISGNISSSLFPTFTYTNAGNYAVTLTATNPYGSSTYTNLITVTNTTEPAAGVWFNVVATNASLSTNSMQSQDVYSQRFIYTNGAGLSTAMRFWVDRIDIITTVKGELFNAVSNKLASGTAYVTGTGWCEIQWDTASRITNNTGYIVAFSSLDNYFPISYGTGFADTYGIAGGSSYYSSMPLNTLPASGSYEFTGSRFAFGLNVTLDPNPRVATHLIIGPH